MKKIISLAVLALLGLTQAKNHHERHETSVRGTYRKYGNDENQDYQASKGKEGHEQKKRRNQDQLPKKRFSEEDIQIQHQRRRQQQQQEEDRFTYQGSVHSQSNHGKHHKEARGDVKIEGYSSEYHEHKHSQKNTQRGQESHDEREEWESSDYQRPEHQHSKKHHHENKNQTVPVEPEKEWKKPDQKECKYDSECDTLNEYCAPRFDLCNSYETCHMKFCQSKAKPVPKKQEDQDLIDPEFKNQTTNSTSKTNSTSAFEEESQRHASVFPVVKDDDYESCDSDYECETNEYCVVLPDCDDILNCSTYCVPKDKIKKDKTASTVEVETTPVEVKPVEEKKKVDWNPIFDMDDWVAK